LPLKPLVFQILLALSDGERHGWSLVREIQERTGGARVLPANFYRTLRGLLADGLIEEAPAPPPGRDRAADAHGDPERRRYFRLSPVGRDAARLEARRLQALVSDTRMKRLLKKPHG
jgi:DNA-binding PadR family transcriptional regulator